MFRILAVGVSSALAVNLRNVAVSEISACQSDDVMHRAQFQNTLAGACEEMCKEVGAYPKACTCPNFVQPDSTPGVMTWEELLTHMDNLEAWGKGEQKRWSQQASQLQKKAVATSALTLEACLSNDLKRRVEVQNKLASSCEDMCKEVGAYPKCECPGFAAPDATPGVMTWDELLEHMDNLEAWGVEMLKKQKARAGGASMLLQSRSQTGNVSNVTLAKHNATEAKKVQNATKQNATVAKKASNDVTFSKGSAKDTVTVVCGTCVDHSMQNVFDKVKVCGSGMVAFYEAAGCVEPAVIQIPALCQDGVASPATVRSMKSVAC